MIVEKKDSLCCSLLLYLSSSQLIGVPTSIMCKLLLTLLLTLALCFLSGAESLEVSVQTDGTGTSNNQHDPPLTLKVSQMTTTSILLPVFNSSRLYSSVTIIIIFISIIINFYNSILLYYAMTWFCFGRLVLERQGSDGNIPYDFSHCRQIPGNSLNNTDFSTE